MNQYLEKILAILLIFHVLPSVVIAPWGSTPSPNKAVYLLQSNGDQIKLGTVLVKEFTNVQDVLKMEKVQKVLKEKSVTIEGPDKLELYLLEKVYDVGAEWYRNGRSSKLKFANLAPGKKLTEKELAERETTEKEVFNKAEGFLLITDGVLVTFATLTTKIINKKEEEMRQNKRQWGDYSDKRGEEKHESDYEYEWPKGEGYIPIDGSQRFFGRKEKLRQVLDKISGIYGGYSQLWIMINKEKKVRVKNVNEQLLEQTLTLMDSFAPNKHDYTFGLGPGHGVYGIHDILLEVKGSTPFVLHKDDNINYIKKSIDDIKTTFDVDTVMLSSKRSYGPATCKNTTPEEIKNHMNEKEKMWHFGQKKYIEQKEFKEVGAFYTGKGLLCVEVGRLVDGKWPEGDKAESREWVRKELIELDEGIDRLHKIAGAVLGFWGTKKERKYYVVSADGTKTDVQFEREKDAKWTFQQKGIKPIEKNNGNFPRIGVE